MLQITKLISQKLYRLTNWLSPLPKEALSYQESGFFDLKYDKEDYITEMRARWVIYGNRQRLGFDFDETYTGCEAKALDFSYLVAIHYMYWE